MDVSFGGNVVQLTADGKVVPLPLGARLGQTQRVGCGGAACGLVLDDQSPRHGLCWPFFSSTPGERQHRCASPMPHGPPISDFLRTRGRGWHDVGDGGTVFCSGCCRFWDLRDERLDQRHCLVSLCEDRRQDLSPGQWGLGSSPDRGCMECPGPPSKCAYINLGKPVGTPEG